jgi:hypothetical protein
MAPKLLLLAIAALIIHSTAFASLKETYQRRRILEATVMISIFIPDLEQAPPVEEALPIPPDEYRPIARPESYVLHDGLGTLVNSGEEVLLVTHDHWSQIDNTLGKVEVRSASGSGLAKMELKDFKELIRYRDGGTMIVDFSEEIESGNGVNRSLLPDAHSLKQDAAAGEKVLLTRRQKDGDALASLIEATIEEFGTKEGRPVVRLQTRGRETIVGGDSGGGVWIDGRLAGNMWATIAVEDEQTGASRLTDRSVAALYLPQIAFTDTVPTD